MAIPNVPFEDPDQRDDVTTPRMISPWSLGWWTSQMISSIPADSVGWLVSQGWQITDTTYDTTTVPPTPYYTMSRNSLQNWEILQSLMDEFTRTHNDAVTWNEMRYNDVVSDWTEMITSSQVQFDAEVSQQNAHVTLYLGNLDTYMTEIDNDIAETQSKIEDLESQYSSHALASPGYLLDLGTTELARINEQFAASLATQLQQLTDRGLYSSAVAADITARNHRDRDEQIQLLNDRLNREKLDNDHKLWEQLVAMRSRQAEQRHQVIVEKMNATNVRLAGLQGQHADNMKLMAYQLDERNKLLIGLYGFVERREDVGPRFEDLTRLATSLGDAGGGWITP